jgi:hypothetical protein
METGAGDGETRGKDKGSRRQETGDKGKGTRETRGKDKGKRSKEQGKDHKTLGEMLRVASFKYGILGVKTGKATANNHQGLAL